MQRMIAASTDQRPHWTGQRPVNLVHTVCPVDQRGTVAVDRLPGHPPTTRTSDGTVPAVPSAGCARRGSGVASWLPAGWRRRWFQPGVRVGDDQPHSLRPLLRREPATWHDSYPHGSESLRNPGQFMVGRKDSATRCPRRLLAADPSTGQWQPTDRSVRWAVRGESHGGAWPARGAG